MYSRGLKTLSVASVVLVGGAGALPGRWIAVLALYDLVFGLVALAIFDFLLEE